MPNEKEHHATNCAYVIATSVPHAAPSRSAPSEALSPATVAQPMTDEQIKQVWARSRGGDIQFARDVLAAYLCASHGAVSDKLHTFMNAAAGEGYVLDGVDAADLYIALFPERYAAAIAKIDTGASLSTAKSVEHGATDGGTGE